MGCRKVPWKRSLPLLGHVWLGKSFTFTRDGLISHRAIRIRSDFHNPAKSDSSWIACFTPDWIGANDFVNISQTICQYSLSIVWLVLSDSLCTAGASKAMTRICFDVRRSRVYTVDTSQEHASKESVEKRIAHYMNEVTGEWSTVYVLPVIQSFGSLKCSPNSLTEVTAVMTC